MELRKTYTKLFVVFIIFTALDSVESHNLENMALNKQAYSSSTYENDGPHRVVDGNLSQDSADMSCFHSLNEANNYLEVDLGEKVFIHHVTIYSRGDVVGTLAEKRLRDVELYIGPSNNSYTLYGYYEGVIPKGTIHTFNLTNIVLGQWVKITRSESVVDFFELCEVQVFGYTSAHHYRVDQGRAGVHALNIASTQSLSVHHCALLCHNTNGCFGATYNQGTRTCELLSSDTGVDADGSTLLIPVG